MSLLIHHTRMLTTQHKHYHLDWDKLLVLQDVMQLFSAGASGRLDPQRSRQTRSSSLSSFICSYKNN